MRTSFRQLSTLIAAITLSFYPVVASAQAPMSPPETTNPPVSYATDTPRPTQTRDTLPEVVSARLPQRGIYAAGGGITSTPWRIIINLDVTSAEVSRGTELGSASYADMDENSQWLLAHPELQNLVTLADAAWREEPQMPADPSADYGEIIVFADGNDVYLLDGYGAIEAPAARALLDALHALRAAE